MFHYNSSAALFRNGLLAPFKIGATWALFAVLFFTSTAPLLAAQGIFTLQVGSPPAPAVPLVNHGDTWLYHKGTNAPQAGWTNILDASLDGTWASGTGGFGYGDPGIVGEV